MHQFKPLLFLQDEDLIETIHKSFRVSYIRDTLLRPTMDESSLQTLGESILLRIDWVCSGDGIIVLLLNLSLIVEHVVPSISISISILVVNHPLFIVHRYLFLRIIRWFHSTC